MENLEEYPVVDEDQEAEFIQEYLILNGIGVISIEGIKAVIKGQLEYLVSLGIAERIEEEPPNEF